MSNQKHTKANENIELSIKECFHIVLFIPEFKKSAIISLLGIVIVIVGSFVAGNYKLIINIIGCVISYSGFDQISKIIASIRHTSIDGNHEIINGDTISEGMEQNKLK
ncbi:MAG: hypothetical protein ACOWWR_18020 [Eubacteriales bacterium]